MGAGQLRVSDVRIAKAFLRGGNRRDCWLRGEPELWLRQRDDRGAEVEPDLRRAGGFFRSVHGRLRAQLEWRVSRVAPRPCRTAPCPAGARWLQVGPGRSVDLVLPVPVSAS